MFLCVDPFLQNGYWPLLIWPEISNQIISVYCISVAHSTIYCLGIFLAIVKNVYGWSWLLPNIRYAQDSSQPHYLFVSAAADAILFPFFRNVRYIVDRIFKNWTFRNIADFWSKGSFWMIVERNTVPECTLYNVSAMEHESYREFVQQQNSFLYCL